MKSMSSRPGRPPNLTLRALQPGPRDLRWLHSCGSSESQEVLALLREQPRVLSVGKTLRGFELRTSQTATAPSCEATAYLLPSAEKAVEKDATSAGEKKGLEVGGRVRVAMGTAVTCAPPVMRWRKTFDESPTERSVRPSGDIEARNKRSISSGY